MTSSKYTEVQGFLNANQFTWLVTGSAGFIGSNLVEGLLKLNQKVVGLDNFSTGKSENLDSIKESVSSDQWERFSFVEGDVRNLEACKSAMENADYVLHQAALGSVPRSIDNPILSHDNNVNGQLNMLVAAKELKVKKFVYASSSSVFGDHPELPKVENLIGEQLSPYAVTKYVNELYAKVFSKCYGINVIGLRYFNVFGKRQDPNSVYAAVMPKWIKALMDGEKVAIYGDGKTSRDFCYIENVIQMNILAALTDNPEADNQVYNCACHDRTDLNTLFGYIRDGLSEHLPHIKDVEPVYQDFRAGDIRHSFANIEKAKSLLEYEPTHFLNDGLQNSLDWYRTNLANT
ncbi:SDR family oxidoreductase [Bacteriovoracaceae bacterium]|nr:SDR family oxidoreductase [Bacteriovoracaceae bacterium]